MAQNFERDSRTFVYAGGESAATSSSMSVGTPVTVVCTDGDDALCQDSSGARAWISLAGVSPVQAGDVLLVNAGAVVARVPA